MLLCEDERLDRFVAVKRLHADSPDDVERRFVREAKLGASLNHPNLVSVFDTDTDDEGVLIVMEYVEGVSLAREVRRGPLTPDRVARMARELGAALDHAHAQGVVHRDVKPGNVLLRSDGVTKLVDLGIATAADNTRITHSGTVLGTAAYMAPEQLEGRAADAAADIYGMAAVCFEALCGERPRSGRTPMQIAHAIASGPAPDLLEHWPSAPPAAAKTLRKGMARDPDDRHSSAGELAAELERALTDPAVEPTRPLGAATRTPRFARRGSAAERPEPPGGRGPGRGAAAGLAAAAPAGAASAPRRRGLTADAAHAPALVRTEHHVGRRTRNRLPVIGLAAFIVAFAVAIAIAALSSGGDDDPARSPAGAGAQREDRAGTGGGESNEGARRRTTRRRGRSRTRPSPRRRPPPPAEQPTGQASPQPVSANPAQGAALNDQGFVLMNAGRYEEAVPILQQAVDSFPPGTDDINYAYALFNLGKSLRLAGRPEEAIPILERRLEIPNQTDVVQRELDAARQDAG